MKAISEICGISRILDYGCGEGYGANTVAEAHPQIDIVAMDYDEEAIGLARRKYQRPNLRFIVGDTRKFRPDLGDEAFDLAISFDVVEHIEHRELYFANLTRYLKTEGVLFLSTPCGGRRAVRARPGWAHHKIEYNVRALYDVLRRYFVCSISSRGARCHT
jgi:2-polyprenyl-3-methyl-5-hydroxy-6-metoxy-1,4-benzoquinol methylase